MTRATHLSIVPEFIGHAAERKTVALHVEAALERWKNAVNILGVALWTSGASAIANAARGERAALNDFGQAAEQAKISGVENAAEWIAIAEAAGYRAE